MIFGSQVSKGIWLTLNQRVTGSNPVASTIFAETETMRRIVPRENPERKRRVTWRKSNDFQNLVSSL